MLEEEDTLHNSDASKDEDDNVVEKDKGKDKSPAKEPLKKYSSSSEDEGDGDDWQFFGKNFVEPGQGPGYKSVGYLNNYKFLTIFRMKV